MALVGFPSYTYRTHGEQWSSIFGWFPAPWFVAPHPGLFDAATTLWHGCSSAEVRPGRTTSLMKAIEARARNAGRLSLQLPLIERQNKEEINFTEGEI